VIRREALPPEKQSGEINDEDGISPFEIVSAVKAPSSRRTPKIAPRAYKLHVTRRTA
jgi:hypothetical protein